MDGAAAASSFGVLLQILMLDLLLSGDNALVIALACRKLPAEQARRAAWIGAAGAIGLRLSLTLVTGALMSLPFLQLLSALPLLVIALNLMDGDDDDALPADERQGESSMLAAAGVIIVSDAVMSLDNVVALAAVSGGNFWLLAFGLACTIPLIVFGSFGFSRLMQAYPWVADAGAAMLGWVAGDMIVGDPLIANWVRTQAPALAFVVPASCAIFILVQGRFAREIAQREAPVKKARPKPAAARRAAPEAPAPAPAPPVVRAEPPRVHVAAEAARLVAPPPNESAAELVEGAPEGEMESGDRWMVFGLLALFVIFGLFLTIFVMIPD